MDNGKGVDSSQESNGMGLNNMISRAKVFDGIVQINTAQGKGCLLMVTMPAISLEEEPCYN